MSSHLRTETIIYDVKNSIHGLKSRMDRGEHRQDYSSQRQINKNIYIFKVKPRVKRVGNQTGM